ncbi:MAG: protein kinase, partial [Anaerolineae bacterium]|nr:protein kinase [Anaerolineae bacterium]
ARQIIDLLHPNIVDIFDCDEDRGLSYMVEEFIPGRTLRDLIDDIPGQPLPFNTALRIAENIAHGLEYAHGHGVIHGDLKPKNVLLSEDQVKISDFGLGRLESGNRALINMDVPLAMVTARYVAPEQVLGHPIDARTDLYALGAILYELFTGHPLFSGADDEVLQHQRHTAPQPPSELNPNLSSPMEHLILKLLDKDPNKRYARASQVRRILGSMITQGQAQFPRQKWPGFVGRDSTLDLLKTKWSNAENGQGQLVLITGEQGVGKTRLIEEFVNQVGPKLVLKGNCRRPDGGAAFRPFVEALSAYEWPAGSDPENHPLRELIQAVSWVVPDIRHHLPNRYFLPVSSSTGATPTAPKADRFSLIETIAEVTIDQPLLLILDDLHWMDDSSLQLFSYLGRHCHKTRLMIIGLYQENKAADNDLLAEILPQLQQGSAMTSVALAPLTEEESKHVLQKFWQQTPPHDLAAAICHRGQGNPYFIEEIAKGLVDDGVVSWRDNKWHFAQVLETGLPKNIRDA